MSRRLILALLLGSCVPAARCAADTQFVLLSGRDTVAVERFTASAVRMAGTLFVHASGIRIDYAVAIVPASGSSAAAPASITLDVRQIAAPDSAPPMQRGICTFAGDTVRVTMSSGKTQVLTGAQGAWPYANPSMAMLALAIHGLRPAPGDSGVVPLFMISGGNTVRSVVRSLGSDSVSVMLGGIAIHFSLDEHGRVNGGVIPAQGLRLESSVVAAGEGFQGVAAPDYSAPAGAPYTAETVRVPMAAGYSLVGTLTVPADHRRALPCVITITGSGLEDRDEALPGVAGYRPFRQIADALARKGIATLRLDDRGFGESGGDPTQATTADFADDVRAALAWMRLRPGIDGHRMVLIGHSEGGLIAPMVAADDEGVRAIVLLAGPARTGRRIIEYQNRQAIARTPGLSAAASEAKVRQAMATVDSIALHTPWLKFFLDCDPLVTARRVHQPVLVLQGANDRQVEAVQAGELAAAFREGGNKDVTVKVLPGLNHLFLTDASGDPAGYSRLQEREIRPEVLALLTDWLAVRLK